MSLFEHKVAYTIRHRMRVTSRNSILAPCWSSTVMAHPSLQLHHFSQLIFIPPYPTDCARQGAVAAGDPGHCQLPVGLCGRVCRPGQLRRRFQGVLIIPACLLATRVVWQARHAHAHSAQPAMIGDA